MPSKFDQEPIVELSYWSVYEVPLYGLDAPWTRHFLRFAEELGLAQVSSAILMFDHEHGVGASANRRVFQLVGKSGRHPQGAQLWERWKTLNTVRQDRDITPRFVRSMDGWRVTDLA